MLLLLELLHFSNRNFRSVFHSKYFHPKFRYALYLILAWMVELSELDRHKQLLNLLKLALAFLELTLQGLVLVSQLRLLLQLLFIF